tara:strand:- start:99 stop:254 length:156 start_codon:yes stop_codon:yes gene_type:complete
MQTAEIFGWIFFFIVITLLFFAAFGGSNLTEESIEEYMETLMKEDASRKQR